MIRNNIKALFMYILYIVVTFAILLIFNIVGGLTELSIGRPVLVKIITGSVVLLGFISIGNFIGIKSHPKEDFKSMILTFIICIGLWYYTRTLGGYTVGQALTGELLPIAIGLSPIIIISIILDIKMGPVFILGYFLVATIIVGLAIKNQRRIVKKRRMQRKRRQYRK